MGALLRLRAALTGTARQHLTRTTLQRLAAGAVRRRAERPVPALRRAYTDLARRQRFTDALLETIEVGIVACDAEGTFLVSNRAERAIFGLDTGLDGRPMEFLGPRIDAFEGGRRLAPDEYPLMRALRGEDVSHLEVLAGPTDGPHRVLVVRGRQITGPGGRVLGAVAALTDVTAERAAAAQLAEEHRRLAEAQRLGKLGGFDYDFVTDRWSFSDHLGALWGLDPAAVSSDAMYALIAEEDRPAVSAAWRAACAHGRMESYDLRMCRAGDGAERLIRVNIEVEHDASGQPVRARGTHLDITDVNAAETSARRANSFFLAILSATPDYTFVTDLASGQVIYASPDKEVLGLDGDDLAALGAGGIMGLAHPEDRDQVHKTVATAAHLADGGICQIQYRARHVDGGWRWLSQRTTPFRRDDDGHVIEVLAVVRDVTDVVDAQEQLVHVARHDYLTGLPNRVLLVERIEAALRRTDRDGQEIAVLFCDLDGFKQVNDVGGHAAGDATLTEVARRLMAVVRDGDIVARLGGDEFVIVIEPWNRAQMEEDPSDAPSTARELAHRIARRVVQVLRRPVSVGDINYAITASVGIAYAAVGRQVAGDGDRAVDEDPVSADELLHRADMAMYRAKQRGKDQFEVFEL